MHRVKNGLISFFRLSLIIPYIFSTYAVNCCLNRSAGYFASTIDAVSGLPTIPPYPLVMPNPDDDVRALWKWNIQNVSSCLQCEYQSMILNESWPLKSWRPRKQYIGKNTLYIYKSIVHYQSTTGLYYGDPGKLDVAISDKNLYSCKTQVCMANLPAPFY